MPNVLGQLHVLGFSEYCVGQCGKWVPVGEPNRALLLAEPEYEPQWPHQGLDCSHSTPLNSKRLGAQVQIKQKKVVTVEGGKFHGAGLRQKALRGCLEGDGWILFQIGRSAHGANDHVVRGPLMETDSGSLRGPVSRYALRIAARYSEERGRAVCLIFAGGFNENGKLTLKSAENRVWEDGNGCIDAVTTLGIRLWKPETSVWREVTVGGRIREARLMDVNILGNPCPEENNEITDGSIIDIGAVQLLFSSAERMARSVRLRPETIVRKFNDSRPQCPVSMHTIIFDRMLGGAQIDFESGEGDDCFRDEEDGDIIWYGEDSPPNTPATNKVPFVFPSCGHVFAFHQHLINSRCPLCRGGGSFVPLRLAWVPAIDEGSPECVFNPCGHVVSQLAAQRWGKDLLLPSNTPPGVTFRPACPFCAIPLSASQPFQRLVIS
jgi:hypothetical protein